MSGIHAKSALGTQEITARRVKMPPRLRMMLILVDGETTDMRLRDEARKIGAPDDFLEQLVAHGLVEPLGEGSMPGTATATAALSEPERFRAAKELMTSAASSFMGLRAFLFILKLEKCATVADLRELSAVFLAGIEKAAGPEQAQVLERHLRSLLGSTGG